MVPSPKIKHTVIIACRCQCWLPWFRSFGYLGKAASHSGSHICVGFPGCISDLLLIAPPLPLLLVPHQLCLPNFHWWIFRLLQLTVNQDWLLEPAACSVCECAPAEWHLHSTRIYHIKTNRVGSQFNRAKQRFLAGNMLTQNDICMHEHQILPSCGNLGS